MKKYSQICLFLCFSYLASLHSPSRKLCHVRHELLCFLLVVVYDRTIFILPNTFNVSLSLVQVLPADFSSHMHLRSFGVIDTNRFFLQTSNMFSVLFLGESIEHRASSTLQKKGRNSLVAHFLFTGKVK